MDSERWSRLGGPARAVAMATVMAATVGCAFDGAGIGDGSTRVDGGPGPILDAPPPPDGDGDGVPDADDNCPAVGNVDQRDHDDDGVGDTCDDCPHIADPEQAQTSDPDPVGDACDPRPLVDGDRIALFAPFDDPAELDAWEIGAGDDVWRISGGELSQTGVARQERIIYWKDLSMARVAIDVGARILTVPPRDPATPADDGTRSVGVALAYAIAGDVSRLYLCNLRDNLASTQPTQLRLTRISGAAVADLETSDMGRELAPGPVGFRASYLPASEQCEIDLGGAVSVTASDDDLTGGGFVGLRTNGVGVAVDYVVVYELAP